MELSVYIYHPKIEQAQALQKFIAAVLFEADFYAKVYACSNATQMNEYIESRARKVDIMVLPVGSDGYALGKTLRKHFRDTTLLYCDGNTEQMQGAFHTLPISYLRQDCDEQLFAAEILRCAAWAVKGKRMFSHESKREIIQCSYKEIDYFESNYRVVLIHLNNGQTKTISAKLDDVQTILPGEMFCRCHQSYLVNLSNIEKIDKASKTVYFTSGAYTFVSKANYALLLQSLSGGDVNGTV